MDPKRIEQWLRGSVPGWAGSELLEARRLEGGWESDIYRLSVRHRGGEEDLVLRLYAGDGAPAKARREFAGMQYLHASGYRVPRVIAVEPGATALDRPFLLMDHVPGEADRSWPEALEGSSLTDFVRLLAALHRVDAAGLAVNHDVPALDAAATLRHWSTISALHPLEGFSETITRLERMAASLDHMPAVLHWDYHVGNVLVGPGSTHVVDWTQIEVNDRRFDVAWTGLLIAMAIGEDAAKRFRLEYERQSGSLPDMLFFDIAAALKRLFSVAISLTAGPEALGMRHEAAARMRRDLGTLAIPYRTIVSATGLRIAAVEKLLE